METHRIERKLTAILSADVKGYSRLMGDDEVATVRTLTTYRELMGRLIRQHRGRVVDSPGDNLLAEFASVVDAVECAAEVQRELNAQNAELPPHRQMDFRIGINLGDGERIYGDGVNIAARVQGLAEGGGIDGHANLGEFLTWAGRPTEAIALIQTAMAEAGRRSPQASLGRLRERLPYKDPAALERYLDGLRKAGME